MAVKNNETTNETTKETMGDISTDTTDAIVEAKGCALEGEKMVVFSAPYVPGYLEDDIRIVRNGMPLTIKRGTTVKIPEGYKYIYDRSQRMLAAAGARSAKMHETFMKAGK